MDYSEVVAVANPTTKATSWPTYIPELIEKKCYGELFLIKDRIVFIKAAGCLTGPKEISFTSSLSGISVEVIRHIYGPPTLKIVTGNYYEAGVISVIFDVQSPTKWQRAIEDNL